MKVSFTNNDLCFIQWYAFHFVCPLPAQLNCCFHRFYSRIHRENLFVAKIVCDKLRILTQLIIMKCPGGKCELLCLFNEAGDDLWVAMALVDRRITAQKIIVAHVINIPHKYT